MTNNQSLIRRYLKNKKYLFEYHNQKMNCIKVANGLDLFLDE